MIHCILSSDMPTCTVPAFNVRFLTRLYAIRFKYLLYAFVNVKNTIYQIAIGTTLPF